MEWDLDESLTCKPGCHQFGRVLIRRHVAPDEGSPITDIRIIGDFRIVSSDDGGTPHAELYFRCGRCGKPIVRTPEPTRTDAPFDDDVPF